MANLYNWQEYVSMSRSKMKQKVPYKTSLPFGKVVPLGLPFDVLPHTTVKLDLANVTRMLTPVCPILDDISMDVYSFFCPWRILFNKTKNFFGENDQVAWTLVQNVSLPKLFFYFDNLDGIMTTTKAAFEAGDYLYYFDSVKHTCLASVFAGSLFDYFGLPWVYPNYDVAVQLQDLFELGKTTDLSNYFLIQEMPFRAVQAIWNEHFRNENISDPILDLTYDDNGKTIMLEDFCQLYLTKTDQTGLTFNLWFLPSVTRYRDLFTTLNPAPQRGPSVALSLNGNDPVVKTAASDLMASNTNPLRMYLNGTQQSENAVKFVYGSTVPGLAPGAADKPYGTQSVDAYYTSSTIGAGVAGGPTNLYADLSSVTMATVNQIRYAFATQRYYEKLARGGARYHEYLRVMFGVRPSDAVLQRPQYLGGHHQHINIQQVLQTSETSSTPLGSTGAYSVSGFKSHTFTNSFTEFGLILTFATTRKQHTYCQGLDKYWTKSDVFDIYNPTFAHIGEVPVMKNEVYWQPGNDDVLGYNEAWYEYREVSPAKVTGLLNPLAPANLSTFVLTDVYDEAPTLSDKFIFEDPNGLDRALVASASYTNQFICDFLFEYTFSVVMPVHSTPGLLDHY